MTRFEEMLMPFGRRVASLRLTGGMDVDASTAVELLDDQRVLQTNVIYLGTAKMAAGLADGSVYVEPSSFILIATGSGQSFPVPEQASKACFAEVHVSLAALFNQVSAYLRTTARSALDGEEGSDRVFLSCWRAVMDQTLTSNDSIRRAIAVFYPGMKSFVHVMCVRFDEPAPAESYRALLAELRAVLPEAFCERWEDSVVVLTSHEGRTLKAPITPEQHRRLEQLMERCGAGMIMSHGFRPLDMLRTNFMLCERTLQLARKLPLLDTGRVNTFDRYSMYCVIDLAGQQFIRSFSNSDIIFLIHPAIVQITRYDREHGTTLRDTLFYYLLHSHNLARTAEATFMHRNTVMNRINKVVELTGIDLTDGGLSQRLMFSCQLIQYYERVLELPLKLGPAGDGAEKKTE